MSLLRRVLPWTLRLQPVCLCVGAFLVGWTLGLARRGTGATGGVYTFPRSYEATLPLFRWMESYPPLFDMFLFGACALLASQLLHAFHIGVEWKTGVNLND